MTSAIPAAAAPRKSDPHGPTHLVDRLNKAELFDLALEQSAVGDGRRAYQLPTREELTPLLPELEIGDLLGTGGMGCVYLAKQPRLDRMVAVKILPKELARDEKFAERFAREARAMARLNHPNVVRVYDFGTAGDIGYLIMEYMDGMNLRELLQAGPLTPLEACRIFDQVSSALQYAHGEGVIHRDIKPENILFSRAGHVSLADFGLARLAVDSGCEVSLTQTRQAMGTLNYMAPEQWDNPKSVDHRADVYAMGILLYELLTGRVPRGSFPPASSLVGVPSSVDTVIHKALQVDADRRHDSVADMNAALEAAMSAAPSTDAAHNGTFTRVLNFGGLLKRVAPSPAAINTARSQVRSTGTSLRERFDSGGVSSVIVCAITGGLMLLPWCYMRVNGLNRLLFGIETSTLVEAVEIPNAMVFAATLITALAIFFRKEVGLMRAHLIGFILCSLAVALLIAMLTREATLISSFDGPVASVEDVRITVAPFIIVGLLILNIIEADIRIAVLLFRPVTEFVVLPVQRHFARKEEKRKQWWRDRWREAKGVFGIHDDPPKPGR